MSTLPPHGTPPPYAGPLVPPPRPRRRRPSGWWFALGGGLVVLAIAVGIGLFVWTLKGLLSTEATVPATGGLASVVLEDDLDRDRMLWFEDGRTQQCVIHDADTGDPVDARPVHGEFSRTDSRGSFHGMLRFDPGSGRLAFECTGGGHVLVSEAPRLGGFVGGIVATILLPLVLGGAGVLVLIVTTVLFATGAPRERSA